jgi:hypothetical protein
MSLFAEVINTNCHTTPDSSIPVVTDYLNRFELCAEGTLYPLVRLCGLMANETRIPNLFLSSHVLTLTVIPERSQATTMPKPDKTFPLLILPALPSHHNPWVQTVQVQIERPPVQSRVVVLDKIIGKE